MHGVLAVWYLIFMFVGKGVIYKEGYLFIFTQDILHNRRQIPQLIMDIDDYGPSSLGPISIEFLFKMHAFEIKK